METANQTTTTAASPHALAEWTPKTEAGRKAVQAAIDAAKAAAAAAEKARAEVTKRERAIASLLAKAAAVREQLAAIDGKAAVTPDDLLTAENLKRDLRGLDEKHAELTEVLVEAQSVKQKAEVAEAAGQPNVAAWRFWVAQRELYDFARAVGAELSERINHLRALRPYDASDRHANLFLDAGFREGSLEVAGRAVSRVAEGVCMAPPELEAAT